MVDWKTLGGVSWAWKTAMVAQVGGYEKQEDAAICGELPHEGFFAAVADGVGGIADGDKASAAAVKAAMGFVEGLYSPAEPGALSPIPAILAAVRGEDLPQAELARQAFGRLIEEVMAAAWGAVDALRDRWVAPGTTLTFFWALAPDLVGCGHVGDSFLFRLEMGSPWAVMTERHGFGRILTCGLGMRHSWEEVRAEMTRRIWTPSLTEIVLLTTDGLTPGEGDEVIPPLPEAGKGGAAYLDRLYGRSRDMKCRNNATGIMVQWGPVPRSPTGEEATGPAESPQEGAQ